MKRKIYSLVFATLSMGTLPTMAAPEHPLPMVQENEATSENDLEAAQAQLAVWQEKAEKIIAELSNNDIQNAAAEMADVLRQTYNGADTLETIQQYCAILEKYCIYGEEILKMTIVLSDMASQLQEIYSNRYRIYDFYNYADEWWGMFYQLPFYDLLSYCKEKYGMGNDYLAMAESWDQLKIDTDQMFASLESLQFQGLYEELLYPYENIYYRLTARKNWLSDVQPEVALWQTSYKNVNAAYTSYKKTQELMAEIEAYLKEHSSAKLAAALDKTKALDTKTATSEQFIAAGDELLNQYDKAQNAGNYFADARQQLSDYIETLEGLVGLQNELNAVLAHYPSSDSLSVDEIEGAVMAMQEALEKAEKALETYNQLLALETTVATYLESNSSDKLSAALTAAQAFDKTTATTADFTQAFTALHDSYYTCLALAVPMDQWNFNTSTSYTIDAMPYYIDTTNKLAQAIGFRNNMTMDELVIPCAITVNGEEYTVVSFINKNKNSQPIKQVTLPTSLVHIGDYAFYYYQQLQELDIPENVTSIGSDLFYGADKLWLLRLHTLTPPACSGAFGGNSNKKVIVPDSCIHAYRVASIWTDCLLVEEHPITVTAEIAEPGELGRLIVDIAGHQQEVNKLIVTGELNTDDWKTIKNMNNLIEVDLSQTVNTVIPSSQFYGKWAIEKVELPQNLKTINDNAFRQTRLQTIAIPDKVTNIGYNAFYGCSLLERIELPNSVTSLGSDCFENCSSLKEVVLSNQLTTIPSSCFRKCDIRELQIPASVRTINYDAFYSNRNLKSITFEEGLQTIDSEAFRYCATDTLVMPSTLKTIGSNAFANCTKLVSLKLNEGLQTINSEAFYQCNQLSEVVLPSSLTYCQYPFSYCTGLKKLYARSVIPATTDGKCPIYNVSLNDVTLYVPVWSRSEYLAAPGWNQFVTVENSDFMPQNVVIYKDFIFGLRDTLDTDYRPNIYLQHTNQSYTNAWGWSDYYHGNLKINSRSKLPVNNFEMVMSPYAKYYVDRTVYNNEINNSTNYYYSTEYNPTSLIVNGEMRAENVTLNMLLSRSRWQFISFPFDVRMSDIVPVDSTTQWVVREYDGEKRAMGEMDSTWVNVPADGVLAAGKGYIMHCYNNNSDVVRFTVTPDKESVNRQAIFIADNREVALQENLAEFEHNRSWNLIGNPYPCYFDSRYLDTEAPITVWNTYNNSYYAYSPVDDAYILSPGEAFFIQRPVDQESLVFDKTGRQTNRYARNLDSLEVSKAPMVLAPRKVYNFTLANGELSDRTRIVFNESASVGYESTRDASKFMSENMEMPQLFSVNGVVRYAINERPMGSGEVALGIRIAKAGTYTISLQNAAEDELYLEDRLTGAYTKLGDGAYSFEAEAGEELSRFVLHVGAPTGINAVEAEESEQTPVYNLGGQRVGKGFKGVTVKQNQKLLQK